jgi:hypothetical protein
MKDISEGVEGVNIIDCFVNVMQKSNNLELWALEKDLVSDSCDHNTESFYIMKEGKLVDELRDF